MVTVKDLYYERANDKWWANKIIHLRNSRGCWYQDHMLGLFVLYQDFEVNEALSTEDDNEVFIELKGRANNGRCIHAL